MRTSVWSSDVCSSDLLADALRNVLAIQLRERIAEYDDPRFGGAGDVEQGQFVQRGGFFTPGELLQQGRAADIGPRLDKRHQFHQQIDTGLAQRSEEHTSELQSLMRNSYAVFCLKKKN